MTSRDFGLAWVGSTGHYLLIRTTNLLQGNVVGMLSFCFHGPRVLEGNIVAAEEYLRTPPQLLPHRAHEYMYMTVACPPMRMGMLRRLEWIEPMLAAELARASRDEAYASDWIWWLVQEYNFILADDCELALGSEHSCSYPDLSPAESFTVDFINQNSCLTHPIHCGGWTCTSGERCLCDLFPKVVLR